MWHDDDNDDLERWQRPGSDDFDDEDMPEDSDDDGYVPCPHCGQTMLEDADYCPSCDRWISAEDNPRSSYPAWTKIVAAILLLAILSLALRGL